MNLESLREAILEAERFLKRAKELYKADAKIRKVNEKNVRNQFNPDWVMDLSVTRKAAVRRASMDLTRALAKLRRYN